MSAIVRTIHMYLAMTSRTVNVDMLTTPGQFAPMVIQGLDRSHCKAKAKIYTIIQTTRIAMKV